MGRRRKVPKFDGYYMAAHKILTESTRKISRGVRINKGPRVVDPRADVVHNDNECVYCDVGIQVSFGSIKVRLLKGYTETTVEGNKVDPTTGRGIATLRVFPRFVTGRLCLKCQASLTAVDAWVKPDGRISTHPKRTNEYEVLQEKLTERTTKVVTKRLVEIEDEANERMAELEKPHIFFRKAGVRVKINDPFEPMNPDTDNDAGIHIKAFKKYGSASRGGMKNYDPEVNFHNQKRAPKP